MFQDKNTATFINDTVLQSSKALNATLVEAQRTLSKEEFDTYRESISKVLTIFLTDIMNPMYITHPDLKPKELK